MKHSSLVAFLNGDLAAAEFSAEIGAEVTECNAAFKAGGNAYIVIEDGPPTVVTRAHALRLLSAIADDQLSFEAANYTADCLIMSDDFDFEDALVNEAINFVEDDSVLPTRDEILGIINRLS